ncbi:tRNA-dependent cyclodipeptide synthase [Candidatus Nomurabacteria bacterium]|nr:tRNA-dependent cyclodipeptide synthase [Candidatus Nomurabacteria bacterium]
MNVEDFLVIGMSPGNGYFKQEVIDRILKKYSDEYLNLGIFIPDVPAISTYLALGYSENIARGKKAIPQGNNFKNRVKRSIKNQNLNESHILVFDWQKENIENNNDYKKEYNYVKNLYFTNKDFEKDINQATKNVLIENPFKKKSIELSDIQIGTHYILSEFAFMKFLPKYLKQYNKFIYGYHKEWDVFEKFINGFYDDNKKDNLVFLKIQDFSY